MIKILPTQRFQTWKDGTMVDERPRPLQSGPIPDTSRVPLQFVAVKGDDYVRPIPQFRRISQVETETSIMNFPVNAKWLNIDYTLSLSGGSHTFTDTKTIEMTDDGQRHFTNEAFGVISDTHLAGDDEEERVTLYLIYIFSSRRGVIRTDEEGENRWMFPDIYLHGILRDGQARKLGSMYAMLDVTAKYDLYEEAEGLTATLGEIPLHVIGAERTLPGDFDPFAPWDEENGPHPWDINGDGVLSDEELGLEQIPFDRIPTFFEWEPPPPEEGWPRNEWEGDGSETAEWERVPVNGTIIMSITPWSANEWGWTP